MEEVLIRFEGVEKRYPDGTLAVRELNLEVRSGEILVLIGPSGCGKTTTLRMLNRLIEPTAGRILLHGRELTTLDPVKLRLRMGYVIQGIGLFPHMRIRENVATVPRLKGIRGEELERTVRRSLELVGLPPEVYGNKWPFELSGGQQQRIGVARALAGDPEVILMDEPFGALDPLTRESLQDELLRLHRELGKTIVFVTHDLAEAMKLGSRIAVFREGRPLQVADPLTLLSRPADDFVRDFVGADDPTARFRLMRIDQIPPTTEGLPTVSLSGTIGEARTAIRRSRLRFAHQPFAYVLDESGRLAGYAVPEGSDAEPLASRLRPLIPLGPEATIRDALLLMVTKGTINVPLKDSEEKFRGVLTFRGLNEYLLRTQEAQAAEEGGELPCTAE
jgi:osmoprotectant transport system ATP-binding protein